MNRHVGIVVAFFLWSVGWVLGSRCHTPEVVRVERLVVQQADVEALSAVAKLARVAFDKAESASSKARTDTLRCILVYFAEHACRGKVLANGRMATKCIPLSSWHGWGDDWDRCKVCGYGRECNRGAP